MKNPHGKTRKVGFSEHTDWETGLSICSNSHKARERCKNNEKTSEYKTIAEYR